MPAVRGRLRVAAVLVSLVLVGEWGWTAGARLAGRVADESGTADLQGGADGIVSRSIGERYRWL